MSSSTELVKSILNEWKNLKLGGSNDNILDLGLNNSSNLCNGESSAVLGKQLSTNNNTNSIWGKTSVWGSPQSPSPSSIGTQYFSSSSHSNSKESLWASTHSSPTTNNNNNNNANSNVNKVTNLWDNPFSKLSQQALMQTKEANASIWSIPRNMLNNNISCSNSGNVGSSSGYETLLNSSKTIITTDPSFRLLRPHDIISYDSWNQTNNNNNNTSSSSLASSHNNTTQNNNNNNNNNSYIPGGSLSTLNSSFNNISNLSTLSKIKEQPVGSLWASPNSTNNLLMNSSNTNNSNNNNNNNNNNSISNQIPMKLNSVKSLRFGSPPPPSIGQHTTQSLTSSLLTSHLLNSGVNINNNTAASSCLQLFSDEFLNYLNMIN